MFHQETWVLKFFMLFIKNKSSLHANIPPCAYRWIEFYRGVSRGFPIFLESAKLTTLYSSKAVMIVSHTNNLSSGNHIQNVFHKSFFLFYQAALQSNSRLKPEGLKRFEFFLISPDSFGMTACWQELFPQFFWPAARFNSGTVALAFGV